MGRLIDVDWAELKNAASIFENNSNELKDVIKKFDETIESSKIYWKGFDSENFFAKCQEIDFDIRNEIEYLKIWQDFLTKSSSKYDENVEFVLKRLNNINNDLESME